MNITKIVTGPLSVNTWFIPLDAQRLVVVDPGGDIDSIIARVAKDDSSVALILLTHGHFDHMLALPALSRSFPEADIAIHPADSMYLGDGALARHHAFFEELGAGSMIRHFQDPLPPATVFLEEGTPIRLKDGTTLSAWTVLHTPGHSAGSICLYNSNDHILISGDTLFSSGFGRTDAAGGSIAALQQSLERLFTLPDETVVLTGHGRNTTIGQERTL